MVEKVTAYRCECHDRLFISETEAVEHELDNSKCFDCGVHVENIDWSRGNFVVCPDCKPKRDQESEDGLNALFG